AWGIVNWPALQFAEAVRAAKEQGVEPPCAAQLPYSLARRDWVEDPDMGAALEASGAGLVASYVMTGGVLTGKYDTGETGRSAGELDDPRLSDARTIGRRLRTLASGLGVSPAALAIAFALAHPAAATVLLGATTPAQIAENVAALSVDPEIVDRLQEL